MFFRSRFRISHLLCFVFLFLILIFIPHSVEGNGDLSGEWENSLLLSPGSPIKSFDSSLIVEYSLGEMQFSSASQFDIQGYSYQAFQFGHTLGPLELDSDFSLDPDTNQLNYYKAKAEIPYEKYEIEGTFLLEHLQSASEYGSGAEVEVLGRAPWGGAFKVSTLLNLEREFAESLGLQRGSGYNIVNPSSQLNYESTDIYLTGFQAGRHKVSVSSKIGSEKGLESIEVQSNIRIQDSPVSVNVNVEFRPQSKSIKLNPQIEFEESCLTLHADFSTPNVNDVLENRSNNNKITGLEIEGFEVSGLDLGGITFSSKTALAGNLYRFIGRDDLYLSSGDYVIDPEPGYETLYERTSFNEVLSIEKPRNDSNLGFGLDVYFAAGGTDSLFELAQVTGTLEYRVSDQVLLEYGSTIGWNELKKFLLGARYNF